MSLLRCSDAGVKSWSSAESKRFLPKGMIAAILVFMIAWVTVGLKAPNIFFLHIMYIQ
jgi:hypothetical protein